MRRLRKINGNFLSEVNDYSFGNNFSYIVWDSIKGEYFRSYLRKQTALDWYNSVSLIEQLLIALKPIHEIGVAIGNINPNMIIVSNRNTLSLTDYCDVNYHEMAESAFTLIDNSLALYYAPEVIDNNFDFHADLYSVGVILFELLTGKHLTQANDCFHNILRSKNSLNPKPRGIVPSIPLGLEQIVIKALSANPKNRFNSADDFLNHLKKLKDNPETVYGFNSSNTKRHPFFGMLKKTTGVKIRWSIDLGVLIVLKRWDMKRFFFEE